MKIPFGVPFSCYYGYETVAVNEDPMADGVLTIDEDLEQRILISNEFLTNVIFNLGYMYKDVLSIIELNDATTMDYE